jgi:hypothetical protein
MINWIGEDSATSSAQVAGAASLRAKVGARTRVGPAIGASYNLDSLRMNHAATAPGADVPTAVRSTFRSASAFASLAQTTPFVNASPDRNITGWGAVVPLIGASLDFPILAEMGISRLGRTRTGS